MRRWAPLSLRSRVLLLVLLALLPALGLTIYEAFDARRAAAAEAKGEALRLARGVSLGQERLIEEARQLLIALAELPEVRADDPAACNRLFAELLRKFPRDANLGLVRPNGDIVCSGLPMTRPVNAADRTWFQRTLETRDFAVGDYQIGRITHKPSINFGYPVLDEGGRLKGVVFAALGLNWVNRHATGTALPSGGVLTVLDRNGTILARHPYPERWVGRSVPEAPVVEAVLARREGIADVHGVDGVPRFYGFTPLVGEPRAEGVYVAIGIPKAEALAAANRALRRDLIVLGLVGILALMAAWAGGHLFLLRPMDALRRAAKRLAAGDLSARTGFAHGPRELRQLAHTFDEMAASLQQLNEDWERRVIERTEQLDAANSELESQNAELELQTVQLEDQQAQLASANDELEAQQAELERALAELAEEKERIEVFFGFGERLASETEVEALAQTVLMELCDFAGAEIGTVYAVDEERGDAPCLFATRGVDRARLPGKLHRGDGLAGRALEERRLVALSYGRTGLRLPAFGEEVAVRHELHVPLLQGGRRLGVLTLARVTDRAFSQAEREVIEHLAGQAAVALSNALSLRRALEQANIIRAVLDATVDGIRMFDLEGNTLVANAQVERIATEVFGQPVEGTIYERAAAIADRMTDPAGYQAALDAMAADPEHESLDEFQHADSGRSFQRYTAPVRDSSGALIGRISVLREVTAEREAERLKSELVATVSHELRTPLASILGFAELLLARDLDTGTRRRYLETIYKEARRLTGLINDFLDLQRIEEGRFTLAREPLDLGALLAQELELFSGQSALHTLELDLPAEPLRVLGDRDRIAQVAGNLISNAIKYSPAGGNVKVAAKPIGGAVSVSVTDSGLGIPADQQQHLFKKFFRVDSSDTRKIGGTGLGLALCREIVEAHGGRICFESVEGEGSTFWFELPAVQQNGGRRQRVLVIEDDPVAASLLSEYLVSDGYPVEVAATGEEGLSRAEKDPPGLVCLDIGLPGELDGWQVLARLKENPATAHVPVVVCTAGNGRGKATVLGAADFLIKPFSQHRLRETVTRLLPADRGSVLVVDDDESVRRLVLETLGSDGLELREAADGEEALAAVAERKPDAIVLDLVMPKLDGFAVLERLQDDPKTRLLPVVVLTARRLSAKERSSLKARAVSLLEKSAYSPEELRRLIHQAIGSNSAE